MTPHFAGSKVRDFVYLDTDRVKSLISQIEEGLIISEESVKGESSGGEGGGKAGIPGLVELGASGTYLREDRVSVTRTFHDHVFNLTEQHLIDLGLVTQFPGDFTSQDTKSDALRSSISPVGYILADGMPQLLDFQTMSTFIKNFNSTLKIVHSFQRNSELSKLAGKERAQRNNELNQELAKAKMDDDTARGLSTIIDMFYRDRLVIKILPFPDPDTRIVGPLRTEFLRDTLDEIRYKYGSAPAGRWKLFGQVSALPNEGESRQRFDQYFSNKIEGAMSQMFEALREIEKFFGVAYPEIAVTPIAVYRE